MTWYEVRPPSKYVRPGTRYSYVKNYDLDLYKYELYQIQYVYDLVSKFRGFTSTRSHQVPCIESGIGQYPNQHLVNSINNLHGQYRILIQYSIPILNTSRRVLVFLNFSSQNISFDLLFLSINKAICPIVSRLFQSVPALGE